MNKDKKKELIKELRSIRDDKDFVCGAMSNAGTEKAWEVMLDVIQMARAQGEDLSSDEVLLLSLELGDEYLSKSKSGIHKKVTAAVL